MYYNSPNYIDEDVIWTPIEPINGSYTVNMQLQSNHAILIRREYFNNYMLLYHFFNGTSTATTVNFTLNEPLFVSQQIMYSNGVHHHCGITFHSKYPNRTISEECRNGKDVSNWLVNFYAKFE